MEVTLLALVVLLLDADVMLDGIVAALAEGPGGLGEYRLRPRRSTENKEG